MNRGRIIRQLPTDVVRPNGDDREIVGDSFVVLVRLLCIDWDEYDLVW